MWRKSKATPTAWTCKRFPKKNLVLRAISDKLFAVKKPNKQNMTKKHFEFIASTIAARPDFTDSLRNQKASCARAIADALQKENPKFNRALFIKACSLRAD